MSNTGPCDGFDGDPMMVAGKSAQHIIRFVVAVTTWVTSAECVDIKPASTVHQHGATHQANALSTRLPSDLPLLRLSNLGNGSITHIPTITMHVVTCHGQANVDILPVSGADICAAGHQFVKVVGEHMDNLAHSDVAPRAVNGATLHPV